ncbi:MAG TPA: hypothetical protein VF642_12285 [Propionibacteriaceae bacterium]
MTIDRAVLTAAAKARLDTVTGATKSVGEPRGPLPLIPGSDGRVKPYAILWPGAGTPGPELDLGDTVVDLDWLIQITCAGGFVEDVQALVTRVDAAFYRWTPVIEGLSCGPFRPPAGYDPGPVRLDISISPNRPFLPLQYRTTITAD